MSDIYQERAYKSWIFRLSVAVRLLVLVFLALLLVYAGRRAYQFGYALFREEAAELPPGRDIAVLIPEDADIRRTAEILEADGLIRDADIFVIRDRLTDETGEIHPGSYVLNTSMTGEEMLEILRSGKEAEDAGSGQEQ